MQPIGWREPMLASLTQRRFPDEGWIFERKLDGVRAISLRDGGEPELWSRTGKPMSAVYPEIVDALAELAGPRFVADGEIVAFEGERTSFAALQPRIHLTGEARIQRTGVHVYYYLFDLISFDGLDATPLPLRQRKELLADAFSFTDPLRLSEYREGSAETYLAHAREQGWEGLIAKRADSPYRSGRGHDWVKLKIVTGQEFVVGGFTDPEGTRVGLGALLVGYYADGVLHFAGRVGTGFDNRTLRRLRSELDGLETEENPFAATKRERGMHWVRPELVVAVEFGEWTPEGKLRHPRFTGVRTDKAPTDVVRE